jgi:hypothetical protein
MNERIKQLAEQAGITTNLDTDYYEKDMNKWVDYFSEKFAELIVRECIGCCEQVISDPVPKNVDTWLNGGSQCMAEIKEHFGVEE